MPTVLGFKPCYLPADGTNAKKKTVEVERKKVYNGKLQVLTSCLGPFNSGAPAAEGRQAEPHTHIRELKETHELIFSCVPWLAVLLVGAYARRRRRRRWSRATWRPYSNNRLTETCSLGLPCTSLISDIHVMIN